MSSRYCAMEIRDQIKNTRVVSINYAKGEAVISLRKPQQKALVATSHRVSFFLIIKDTKIDRFQQSCSCN